MGYQIGEYTKKIFKKRKIRIYLSTALKEVSKYNAILDDGSKIETNTVISTIGSTASKLVANSSLPLKYGKIVTDQFMEVVNYKNVWALGDVGMIPNAVNGSTEFSPPTAQFAVRQAKCLAKNIMLREFNRDLVRFKYKSKGSLASLGSKVGVGKIFFL